jgi:ABC-type lipoprotein release transport system permease subunit
MSTSTLRMAWRGLSRHPRRTLLIIGMIAFASFVIILLWGTIDGFMASMTDAQITVDQGSLKVRAAGYENDPAPGHGLTQAALLDAETALHAAGVERYAQRLAVFGMAKSAYGANSVEIRGIDISREPAVTTLPGLIADGRRLAGTGEVLLSADLAERLDVRVGERLVLVAQGETAPRSFAFTAVGFFASGMRNLDQNTVLIDIDDARKLTGWNGATEIAVALPRSEDADRVATKLEASLGPSFDVRSYLALNPFLAETLRVAKVPLIPVLLILSLLAGFGVANTVLFSVLERTREFGVMIAVGMSPRRLARMVEVEALLATVIGFIAGGAVGYLLLLWLAQGVSIGASISGNVAMPSKLYASTSGWYWLASFSVVVVTGLLAAWYPARRAASLQPVEAIRET